ncbi:hypothetical protein [Campylobacter lari]|uniref:hypothetical protein n=1 Tax=Campylobacter lari TaxID=201 RepID=UPI00372D13B7
MTAYVHIGTEKTGTTSIQKFLSENRYILEKNNILYSYALGANDSQWDFAFLAYNNIRDDEYCLSREIYSKEKFLSYKRKLYYDLKSELNKSCCNNIVISSEHLSSRLQNIKEIKRLRKILYILGFNNIKIIVYLREVGSMSLSSYSTELKAGKVEVAVSLPKYFENLGNYKKILSNWISIFGKENIIVRIFDKLEFYKEDLIKDFSFNIGLKWNEEFKIPNRLNTVLDLMGFELLKRINQRLPWKINNQINYLRGDIGIICERFFSSKDPFLKFNPPKEIMQSYIDYFEESNEWVRKEFFPHKERLFPKKDLSNYKENYELKEMKPEYWDKIAEFIADIIKTKNKTIIEKDDIIQNLSNILKKTTKDKEQIINSKTNQIIQLQNNIQENSTQLNQVQSKLLFQTKYGTAKSRIQNQLSYKLGQAMIVNSKSILGYLITPMVLLSVIISHKQEQKIYQEKIKKDPSLKLPPLEDYPDYKEVSKLKNHLSYKLGQALVQANKTWYRGGYVKLWFEVRKLKREFRNKI